MAYEITNGLIAGVNISYDEAFETRVSADVEYRFGGASKTADKKKVAEMPVINALSSSPKYRNVRIHDKFFDFINVNKVVAAAAIDICLGRQDIPSGATINGKTLAEYVTDAKVANFIPVLNALAQNTSYDTNTKFDRLATDNKTYRFNLGGAGSIGKEKDSFGSCFVSQVDQLVVVSGN